MLNSRHAILQLIANGRITPSEAERLLIAWNEGREVLWALAVCLAVSVLAQLHSRELLPGLAHIAHSLLPGSSFALHRTLLLLNHLLGGTL